MAKYSTVRLTEEENELLTKIRNKMAISGLPDEVYLGADAQDIDDYFSKVNRDSFSKGALAGLGLAALLYLLSKKE